MRTIYPHKAAHSGLVHAVHGATLGRVADWLDSITLKHHTGFESGSPGDDGRDGISLTCDHVEADPGNYSF